MQTNAKSYKPHFIDMSKVDKVESEKLILQSAHHVPFAESTLIIQSKHSITGIHISDIILWGIMKPHRLRMESIILLFTITLLARYE